MKFQVSESAVDLVHLISQTEVIQFESYSDFFGPVNRSLRDRLETSRNLIGTGYLSFHNRVGNNAKTSKKMILFS